MKHHFIDIMTQPSIWYALSILPIWVVLLILELKQVDHRVWLTSTLIVGYWLGYILLMEYFSGISQKYLRRFAVLGISALVLNFFLNFINIYDVVKEPWVAQLCLQQTKICAALSLAFNLSRLNRFITLSTTFLFLFAAFFVGIFILQKQKKFFSKHFTKHVFSSFDQQLRWVFFGGLVMVMLVNLATVTERIDHLVLESWYARQLSFADRFLPYEFGVHHQGWIWPYSRFLLKHVPEDGVFFIPPQNITWAQEGNQYYFRWFIYPRKMLQSSDAYASLPIEAQYVIVSNGGWSGGAAGWPKIHIPEDRVAEVYLIDRYSLRERTVSAAEYYQTLTQTEWGVMKLK